jgi:hypothetical protein
MITDHWQISISIVSVWQSLLEACLTRALLDEILLDAVLDGTLHWRGLMNPEVIILLGNGDSGDRIQEAIRTLIRIRNVREAAPSAFGADSIKGTTKLSLTHRGGYCAKKSRINLDLDTPLMFTSCYFGAFAGLFPCLMMFF